MDAIVSVYGGLAAALQPMHLAILVMGLLVGVLAGALPGISFVNAMAFLAGIYVGGVFGGSICAILLNIPGDPDSVPSCWDGYPLSKKKGSVYALSVAITADQIAARRQKDLPDQVLEVGGAVTRKRARS